MSTAQRPIPNGRVHLVGPRDLRCVLRGACVFLLFTGTGCSDPRPGIEMEIADGAELPILRQVQGPHSHETRPMRLVIRDAAAWAQVHVADIPVDFEREMVLVVTLGSVLSDQYDVRIERIWRAGSRLKVATVVRAPPVASSVEPACPFCVAVVPRCGLNIEGFDTRPPARSRPWMQSPPPEMQ